MIGSGIGGLPGITEGALTLHERGPRRVSPFFIPSNLINLASGHVSIRYGFSGPEPRGRHRLLDRRACDRRRGAADQSDDADVMVGGGTEAAVCRLGIAGFAAARALSTGFNDEPQRASRPWDKARDGFVMGEGAGIVVLEELEHAKAPRRQDLCRDHRLRHVGRRATTSPRRPRTATAPSAPCATR